MKIRDRGTRKGYLQIVSQERGGGDKLETDVTYPILDCRYVTSDNWLVVVLGSGAGGSYRKT